jgi:hypothetical protein
MMTLHQRLVSAITEQDRRDQVSAARRGHRDNPYRLAHMIGAAQDVTATVGADATPLAFARACADAFTPSAWLTRFFRTIGVTATPNRNGYDFQESCDVCGRATVRYLGRRVYRHYECVPARRQEG